MITGDRDDYLYLPSLIHSLTLSVHLSALCAAKALANKTD